MMRLLLTAALLIASAAAFPWAQAAEPPPAVISDPPQDKIHPATTMPFALPTHGVRINAMLFVASGAGPHPAMLLLHGVPGNDQNSDLARAIQRAGWDVLIVRYRGSWGSPGQYSFTHCREDAEAALAWLRATSTSGIDTHRIVVVGHSMGGFLAGWLAGHDGGLAGAAMISAGRSFGNLPSGVSRQEIVQRMEENLHNDDGMRTVGDTTAAELADEVIRNNAAWDLVQFAPAMARRPLLVVTSDDGGAAGNERVAAAATARPGARVTLIHLATDHGYNDQRVTLASTIVRWLEHVPTVR